MSRRTTLAFLFAVGATLIGGGFATIWLSPARTLEHEILRVFFVTTIGVGVCIALLLVGGLIATGQNRWLSFTLVGALLTGYSLLWVTSVVGILVLPVGLALFLVSSVRLSLSFLSKRY